MKKLIVVSAVAVSSMAFAGDYKFNLEGRYDFVNSKVTTTTQAGVASEDKYNNFANGTVRLNMLAKINDTLSFRFRYRFAKGAPSYSSTSQTRNDDSTQLDYLYVDHKNPYFTTRFGKQNWVEAMGRETFVAATDAYVKSQAYSDYQAAFGSDYRAGVSAIFNIMETNNLTVALSNPNTTFTDLSSTTSNNTNSAIAYGVHYNGNFMNKLIQPVLSYQSAKQNGDRDASTKTKDGTNSVWAAGVRSEFSGLTLDVDYKQVKLDSRNDTDSNYDAAKTKSLMVTAAYTINEFTPFVSYINDKATASLTAASATAATTSDDSKAFKKNTFALGVQFKPYSDVNFRYHLAYASSKKEKDGTSSVSKTEDKKIIFGIKADI